MNTNRGASSLRILVLGYIVRGPLGGLAWHHLQYVLGLTALGHDVWFLEDSDDYAGCYDPSRASLGTDPCYGLAFTARTFERVGLADRWAYYDAHGTGWRGPVAGKIAAIVTGADVLLNLSGMNPIRDWASRVPVRVLVDTDPAFTQIRHLTDPLARQRADAHTAFFTFGENFGRPGCSIPDDGFAWQPTRQPIVLDAWPIAAPAPDGHFTTVMQWDSYRTLTYDGRVFGMKSTSFAPYLDLPRRTHRHFALAIGSATAPRDVLTQNDWRIDDPLKVTSDPWTYQDYIAASKGEFSVAKAGYVETRSGWFSERSAAYLASGRPVVVQDTGFTEWLKAEKGVLPFADPVSLLAAIAELDRNYVSHCVAARECAAEWFDARKVLPPMLVASAR